MVPQQLITEVSEFVRRRNAFGEPCETGIPGLLAYCNPQRTTIESQFYEPVMCLVLQGAKEAHVGGRTIRYGAGASLIVSHALPVRAGVTEASPAAPYASLVMQIDIAIVRSLHDEIGGSQPAETGHETLSVAEADAPLLDATARLFRAVQDPVEAQTLTPLIRKEIHFRLLRARHGGMLRQLLQHESPASRICRVISLIRADCKAHLTVAAMAAAAGMSQSTFHEHFKALTATTPLQYQKELRLLEARRLLLSGTPVSAAAYDVGYESPAQFSREYARKFGLPPREERLGAALAS
ncbi:AraC family transcriptional regulator [Leisingera daeponensis]|uniref:AraC family transcriptional regulator n=1 Tax=Leisingera daeponensis TaxID=405746 RepID=A0ABS7NJ40_9RHOB|nr:AraC family transcriptional regulator [Leisingera daeponensis]MBY6141224.1 AraC family transcriptional regulator [Leisingera daeponensis]